MEHKFLQVGQIVKPHGVIGELGVISLTERPDLRFLPGNSLFAGPDESHLEEVVLEAVRPYRQGFLVFFKGVRDRDVAERLRGWRLYIESAEAAEPEEESWYHHELIGLRVLEMDGREVGVVEGVMEVPGHDLLEVKGAEGRRFMAPMVKEIVREVNLESGFLRVSLPEGLEEL